MLFFQQGLYSDHVVCSEEETVRTVCGTEQRKKTFCPNAQHRTFLENNDRPNSPCTQWIGEGGKETKNYVPQLYCILLQRWV